MSSFDEAAISAAVAELISPTQLEAWSGEALTLAEIHRLKDAIPHSSIPDAIGEITYQIRYGHGVLRN